ncbi:spore coat protein [Bacillus subtilis]|nr:spore coat protein [Bacillus subtilis]
MMVFIGSKWFGDNELNNYVKHLHTLGAMQRIMSHLFNL